MKRIKQLPEYQELYRQMSLHSHYGALDTEAVHTRDNIIRAAIAGVPYDFAALIEHNDWDLFERLLKYKDVVKLLTYHAQLLYDAVYKLKHGGEEHDSNIIL